MEKRFLMKAVVYINGLIGNWNEQKGIGLSDVVSQIQAQQNFDEIEIRIGNSIGGVVQTGFDIYNYLTSINKPITTVVESYCASITSIIFLAGEKRLIKDGARLMIHNPWGKPEGDADLLQAYSDELRKVEKNLADIYNKRTNIGKEALTALMRDETEMNADEAISLGFATGKAEDLKIAAYLKLNDMSKKKSLKDQLKEALAKLSGDEPVNLTLQDGTGKEIIFETENEKPTIGDKATVDDAPATGEFVMPNGETLVFENGELKEIKDKPQENEEVAAMIRSIVKEEIGNALKQQNENLDIAGEAILGLTNKYETLAKSVKSSFKIEKKESNSQMYNQQRGEGGIYEKIKNQRAAHSNNKED